LDVLSGTHEILTAADLCAYERPLGLNHTGSLSERLNGLSEPSIWA
jgi:hypothetical protein